MICTGNILRLLLKYENSYEENKTTSVETGSTKRNKSFYLYFRRFSEGLVFMLINTNINNWYININ